MLTILAARLYFAFLLLKLWVDLRLRYVREALTYSIVFFTRLYWRDQAKPNFTIVTEDLPPLKMQRSKGDIGGITYMGVELLQGNAGI
ncbi:MAG: hypothetical protein ACI88A_001515 [Paraglaciecola sp.]|jgi:hypothetical protein